MKLRTIYKIFRNLIFSITLTVIGLFIALYITLSIPSIHRYIKNIAQEELSTLLGGQIKIDNLNIYPFNQVFAENVSLHDNNGNFVAKIDKLGAGINLWKLITNGRIVVTHAEIIGLDANVYQENENSDLNIQFLIDALKPKDKNKPPTKFDLQINSVVLRKINLSFDKNWIISSLNKDKFDPNHIKIQNLRADISLPKLKNDDFIIDLRNLSLNEISGFKITKLKGLFNISNDELSFENFEINMPNSRIAPDDIKLKINGLDKIIYALKNQVVIFNLNNNKITPSDFRAFMPTLKSFVQPITMNLKAEISDDKISLNSLFLQTPSNDIQLDLEAYIANYNKSINDISIDAPKINLSIKSAQINKMSALLPNLNDKIKNLINNVGDINITSNFEGNIYDFKSHTSISSDLGLIDIIGNYNKSEHSDNLLCELNASNIDLCTLSQNNNFGMISTSANINLTKSEKKYFGILNAQIEEFEYKEYIYHNIDTYAELTKDNNINVNLVSEDPNIKFFADLLCSIDNENKHLISDIKIQNFNPFALNLTNKYPGYEFSGNLSTNINFNNTFNPSGEVKIDDFIFKSKDKSLRVGDINVFASNFDNYQNIKLESEFIDGEIEGNFELINIPIIFKTILEKTLITNNEYIDDNSIDNPLTSLHNSQFLSYNFKIKDNNELIEFFNLPIKLIYDINIDGKLDCSTEEITFNLNAPYLQQGKDKLIRNSNIHFDINSLNKLCNLNISTILPGKNGDITVSLNADTDKQQLNTDISWKFDRKRAFKGLVSFSTKINKNITSDKFDVNVNINPTTFEVNDTVWHIEPASIKYSDNIINVNKIKVWQDKQFVIVNGSASASTNDSIKINLKDISLDYIFESLNINHVNFGGIASGEVIATNLLSKSPKLYVPILEVNAMTYNKALLGNAKITSRWNNEAKSVDILADIKTKSNTGTKINGQIWPTRDSLCFDFDANKVNIAFLQPFMSAFCGDVKGQATGKVKLYGTFKEIDLKGDVFADTISLKLDFTNTYYSGSDSVYISPGLIDIRNFTLYDRNKNTAKLNGKVKHIFFKQPSFDFTLTDARNFLCYDTNEKMGNNWYGTVYCDGEASVDGYPGVVNIWVDVVTAPNSNFTFALNNTEEASDYEFLTFSDKEKEKREQERIELNKEPDFIENFKKKNQEEKWSTAMNMNIRIGATNDALMTLIMDPVAGDKIKAYGNGNIQIQYNIPSDEFKMTGNYTLEKGNYNFTLQDIIIRDFKIREGSNISFTGNPYKASLDIDAIYNVNTNLSDLDESFASDKDLNRTNVPVEAVLKVDGIMTQPNISFDIELPTLTQDVLRKVKSIISTEDMMNRQIIYLLALNRFYTPEYMGSSKHNNELASVASSTISSQLSSMFSQLSDNWSVSPYFRTDKGDFSDMEVDLALSSTLLNNRLLLNGNFGYRDRSTSNTTFVGDFDIEYLLNSKGTIRLKAYNHFNDQNYYLKSALTTQGVGIVFKHDFDKWFGFLRRKKKDKINTDNDTTKSLSSDTNKILIKTDNDALNNYEK